MAAKAFCELNELRMPIYVALRSATRTSPPLRTRRTTTCPRIGTIIKHGWFTTNIIDTPTTEILIEHIHEAEHVRHTGGRRDGAYVPRSDVLIERIGVPEHILHIRDTAHVPRSDVLIERTGVVEHLAHGRDTAHVPRSDIRIERSFILEHLAHVRDPTGTTGRSVACRDLRGVALGIGDPPDRTRIPVTRSRTGHRHTIRCEQERADRHRCRCTRGATRRRDRRTPARHRRHDTR